MRIPARLLAGTFCFLMVVPGVCAQAVAEQPAERFEPPPEASMQEVLEMGREAIAMAEYDKATQIHLWLWDNMVEREPEMHAVRLSFLVGQIRDLASRHEAARRSFESRRDQLQERVDSGEPEADRSVYTDWAALNRALDEEDRLLAWWDDVKERMDEPQVARRVGYLNLQLRRVLAEDLRWAELAIMFPDPEGYVRQQHRFLAHLRGLEERLPEEVRQQVAEGHVHRFREEVSTVYAAMLAAGREQEAARVAELAASLDEEPVEMRLALVDTAIGAGEARPEHRQWLDEAAEAGAPADRIRELRRWLDAALENGAPASRE